VETAFEVLSKKLVDIFGDKAVRLLEKKTPRAASMDAYRALREIERAFAEIETLLDGATWQRFSHEQWTADDVIFGGDERAQALGELRHLLGTLRWWLGRLEADFAKIENSMEIYASIAEANKVKMFFPVDTNVLDYLFDFQAGIGHKNVDIPSLIAHMSSAAAKARETLADFISRNFPVEEQHLRK